MSEVNGNTPIAARVRVNGTPLPETWVRDLTELRVDRALNIAGMCLLRFTDEQSTRASDTSMFALGAEVEVSIGPSTVVFVGEVTALESEWNDLLGEFVVTAHDRAHRLGRTTAVATDVDLTYADVVDKVAQEHGLIPKTSGMPAVAYEYVLRADSALGVIGEIAHRTGCDWWVERKELHVAAPAPASAPAATLKLGFDLLRFKVRTTGAQIDEATVKGWDPANKAPVVGQASRTAATAVAAGDLVERGLGKGRGAFGIAKVQASSLSPSTREEATALAEAIVQQAAAASVVARGVALGNPALKPGVTVQIDNAGAASGRYPVTAVEHAYTASGGLLTRFTAGSRRPTALADTLGGPAPGAKIVGHERLVVGIVTNNASEKKPGQVKVKFPNLSDSDESAWCRLLVPDAGADRGSLFVPEVNDEVLVGFEDGDVRRPVVLGGLYGGKTKIPAWTAKDGKVTSRRIRTRTGHILEIGDGDSPSTKHFLFELAGNQRRFRLGDDGTKIEVPAGDPVLIQAGSTKIELKGNGDVLVEGNNITLKAKQKVSIEGLQVEVKAQTGAKVEATANLELKGAMTSVEASGVLQAKGSIVKIN